MFNKIDKLTNSKSKKFFIEKVELFVKIIRSFAKKNEIHYETDVVVDDKIVKRLIDLNIINHKKDT